MAVPSSGQLGLRADIALEIDGSATGSDVSLNTLSSQAGFSVPNGMFEFYGYVDAVAATVQTNSSISITASSMTIRGNVTSDGGGTITERGFYFGTSTTATNNTKYTVSGTTGSFSRSMTGLNGSTTYYAFAYAINSVGETVANMVTTTTATPTVADTFSNFGSITSSTGPTSFGACSFSAWMSPNPSATRSSISKSTGNTVSFYIYASCQNANYPQGSYNYTSMSGSYTHTSQIRSGGGCCSTVYLYEQVTSTGYTTVTTHFRSVSVY